MDTILHPLVGLTPQLYETVERDWYQKFGLPTRCDEKIQQGGEKKWKWEWTGGAMPLPKPKRRGQTADLGPKANPRQKEVKNKHLKTPYMTRKAGNSPNFSGLADSMRAAHQGLNLMILSGGQTSTIQQLLNGPLLEQWFQSKRDLTSFRRELDLVLYTLYKLHQIRIEKEDTLTRRGITPNRSQTEPKRRGPRDLQAYSGNSPRPTYPGPNRKAKEIRL